METLNNRITETRRRLALLTLVLAVGGCVTWPGPSSSGYYGSSYESYGGAYEKRYDGYPYDDGLRYGRPFYTTYGAYPPGFYYDPRFLGYVRPANPPAPSTPPAAPPPVTGAPATPPAPRVGPQPRPDPTQPIYRPEPRATPLPRPAPPPRDPPIRQQPQQRIPQ